MSNTESATAICTVPTLVDATDIDVFAPCADPDIVLVRCVSKRMRRSARLATMPAPVDVIGTADDFCFSAAELASIGVDAHSDDVLAHIYPQGVVVGHLSRE